MRVWLITVGEPLPLPGNRDRLWRTGLLAEALVDRGHEVVWWTSTVDHFRKTSLVEGEPKLRLDNGVWIQFLRGRLYRRNVSISRLLNHAELGRRFAALSQNEARPDIIVCSFPTIELSREAVRYGRTGDVPVVLDVRDLWPDAFLDVVPFWMRSLGKVLLQNAFRDTAKAFESCRAIFAVSEGYLDWALTRGNRARQTDDEVYPLGYRMAEFSAAEEEALEARLIDQGVDPSIPFATFVGTFGRSYDLGSVIRAARLINQPDCRVQFVLCGAGEREREWRAAAAGVAGVAFVGWLPAGELACLLTRSFVGLAAYEAAAPQGVPNKVIEYLAAGLPVLCSLEGESRELLETQRCGAYYPAGDPKSLAEGVRRVTINQTRHREMSEAANRVFQSRFSASAVYGAMADRLERIGRVSAPRARILAG